MIKPVQPQEAFRRLQEFLDQKAENKQSVNAGEINMSLLVIQTDAMCQILEHLEFIHKYLMQQEQRIIQ